MCKDHESKRKRGRKGTYLDETDKTALTTTSTSQGIPETEVTSSPPEGSPTSTSSEGSVVVAEIEKLNTDLDVLPMDLKHLLAEFFMSSIDDMALQWKRPKNQYYDNFTHDEEEFISFATFLTSK